MKLIRIGHITIVFFLLFVSTSREVYGCVPTSPNADFSVDNTSPVVGQPITFSDESVNGTKLGGTPDPITTWTWNFGNGALPATANSQGPHTIIYTSEGLKTISLIVTSENGRTDTETKNDFITVSCSASANIVPSGTTTLIYGETLNIDGNPSGSYGTYDIHEWTGTGASYLSATDIQNPIFSGASVGTYNLTYTVTDSYGCSGTDNITVTVNPKPLTIKADAQSKNCGEADPVLTYQITSGSLVTGDDFTGSLTREVGETLGDYLIQQGSVALNSNYDLTYVPDNLTIYDDEAPTFTCPLDVTVSLSGSCQLLVPDLVSGITDENDNCGTPTISQSPAAGTLLASGHGTTHTVTITADDGNGNTNSCDVIVTGEDTEDPQITCPANVNVLTDPGLCNASGVDLGTPVTSDNCSVASVINDAAEPYEIGDNIITWTVSDVAGNTATCQQTVTVQPEEIIDIQVVDPGNSCQSGETGSQTTITWDISKLAGYDNWSFDYTINDGTSDVASGTKSGLTGSSTQVSFVMDNSTGADQTFTLTVTNVQDECTTEQNTTNNSDSVIFWGVPDTGVIIPD